VSELQHPGARSFELVADLYERVRPAYPSDAIAWIAEQLNLRAGRTVLDLGAGTGKLARALLETGARVIAVEPGDAMRAELTRVLPEVEALRGAAEAIPLPDGSVDAVAVGQAFHWFRHAEAVPELHRVLRPRGPLALVWSSRDQESELQREVSEVISPLVTSRRAISAQSSRALEESELFGSLEERRFRFVDELDEDALAERIASVSFVAAASPEVRHDVDARLRELVRRRGGRVDFAYVTAVYVSRAV
jgi:ubiquinone/menaquinone biosynthesis C-methylase UbiE